MSGFKEIHENTIAVYETHAVGWDKNRSRFLREKPWLDKFTRSLKPGASILDVGCGAGAPISKYLVEQGYVVSGIDSSQAMIEICRSRFSDGAWIVMEKC